MPVPFIGAKVEVTGFEPTASCLQDRRSTSLSYTPEKVWSRLQESNLYPRRMKPLLFH